MARENPKYGMGNPGGAPMFGSRSLYTGKYWKGLKGIMRQLLDMRTPGGIPGLQEVQGGGSISQRWTGATPRGNFAFDSSQVNRGPVPGTPGGPGTRPIRPRQRRLGVQRNAMTGLG